MPFLVQNLPFHAYETTNNAHEATNNAHETAKITQNRHLADFAIVEFSKIPNVLFSES